MLRHLGEILLTFGDRKQSENTVCAVCAGCFIPVDSWNVFDAILRVSTHIRSKIGRWTDGI